MAEELNDVQFDILDALYFVETYDHILEDVEHPEPVIRDEVRTMIDKGWIQVMIFDKDEGDYVRTAIYDTDNMKAYAYLATKDGLLKHNGS